MVDLGDFGGVAAEAMAVSADGSVVIGRAVDAAVQSHPFRWTATEGILDLGSEHCCGCRCSTEVAVVDAALLTEELTNHPHRFYQVLLTLHS